MTIDHAGFSATPAPLGTSLIHTVFQDLPTNAAARTVDLRKVYGSGDTALSALDGVSVEFGRGQFTAIMGPSGSGKSTLLHCLAALDDATSGQVFIGDAELTELTDKQLTLIRRDRVGFVFQSFNLVPTLTAAGEHHPADGHCRPTPDRPGWTQ